ncbi:Frataxin-like domain-containing protein [Aspergillus similis]
MLTGRATRALLSSFPSALGLRRLAVAAPAASTFRFPSPTKLAAKLPHPKGFHSTPIIQKGITPGSPDPPAPQPESSVRVSEPSPLSNHQYHEYSDHYLHVVQARIEEMEEDRSDLETDLSAGILHISVANVGTYVLNKQPPIKQLWLSSPVSGPRQYDWVVEGDQMHEKQETRPFTNGQWVCLRDNSNLTELLNKELGLNLPRDVYSEVDE